MLIVDDREHYFIEILNNNSYIYEKKRLDIGDFHICDNIGNLKVIIERKTVDDYLYSKYVDKHMYDQIDNMLNIKIQNPEIIIVILIDNYKKYEGEKHGITFEKFETSLMHLFLRGFNIIRSKDSMRSFKWIKKINENINYSVENKGLIGGYKKKNKSKQDIYITQLTMLPSISKNMAITISKICPNFNELIKKLNEPNGISGITHNGKKISKKRSDKIKELLT